MKKSLFFVVALTLALSVKAMTWNPFKREGRVKPNTVILTGNYDESRILAELAQFYTRQPVVLVSKNEDGTTKVFYMPNIKEASEIDAKDFVDLVNHIAPKRVIVLGNSDYVPANFIEQIRDKYPVIQIDGADWSKNAGTLALIIEEKSLKSKFDESIKTFYLNNPNRVE